MTASNLLLALPVVEFECEPEPDFGSESGAPKLTWRNRRAIDLRWVASIAPSQEPVFGCDASAIVMCGSAHSSIINMPYDQIMPLWLRAKGIIA